MGSTHRVEGAIALDLDAHAAAPQRLVLQVHQASIAFMGPVWYVSSMDAVEEHMLTCQRLPAGGGHAAVTEHV